MIRLVATLLLLLGTQAAAQGIRDADQTRLLDFDESFGIAIRSAFALGAPDDVTILTEALGGEAVNGPVIDGDWNCRTIKMSVDLLVVYRNFRCQIRQIDASRFELQKLTGSQRSVGVIAVGDDRTIYTGVGYVGDRPAMTYDAFPDPQIPVDPGQTVPQVGIFEQVNPNKARLMLPKPLLESEFDILYLTR